MFKSVTIVMGKTILHTRDKDDYCIAHFQQLENHLMGQVTPALSFVMYEILKLPTTFMGYFPSKFPFS